MCQDYYLPKNRLFQGISFELINLNGEHSYMEKISEVIAKIESGEMDIVSALAELDLRHADKEIHLDHSRNERCGFPEFIFGERKTLEQLQNITRNMCETGKTVLITRLSANFAESLLKEFPDAVYDKTAGIFFLKSEKDRELKGKAIIVTAGTTDLPVAREAKYTLEACCCGTELVADSGVAGIHRLLTQMPSLKKADVVIVVAGMEGALPSVVGGLVPCPVIAVPTSVGYGTALGGLTAMFAMMNSCANGVTVTNIDNGFGAGCAAARIINSKE